MSSVNDSQLVISIVPRLPPVVDGVGDYAFNLACQLRRDRGIDTHFIVGDPSWAGAEKIEGFSTTTLSTCSTAALLNQLAKNSATNPILLHYVGYGYAKRGCPTWLVRGLKIWKRQHRQVHLVTMFHEISASGSIWTSAFWLAAWQRHLAEQLVQMSDRLFTSKQLYAEILQRIVIRQPADQRDRKLPIPALPVFASIGEPEAVLPLTCRQPILVVFGGRASRLRVYQHGQPALAQACQQLGIASIVDIGPTLEMGMSLLSDTPITVLGEQPAAEVSRILTTSLAGFIDYPTDFLGKSSIFANYCAYGVLPIVSRSNGADADGLEANTHYWFPNLTQDDMNIFNAQAIASNAHTWYQNHNLTTQASQFADRLLRHS
jgi:hypothetical protein